MEHYDRDPAGNVLPPGMFWRDGVYYVRRRSGGGTRLKKSTGKRDFKSALRRYHEIMQAWNDGESGWDTRKMPTFREYWLHDYRPAWTLRKTPDRYSDPKQPTFRDDSIIKNFLAEHGSRALDQFTLTLCTKWANKRRGMSYQHRFGGVRKQISEGTVTREIALLQTIFRRAVEDGHLERNPFKGVPKEPYAVRERVLTLEEQRKLLAELTPQYQRWVLFMLGTGLRVTEAAEIQEAVDLDFQERWIRVTRKTRGRKKKVQVVPVFDPYVFDLLQEQLTVMGTLWHHRADRFQKVLARAAKAAGIEHLSPHTLRHTFATRFLQEGKDIYDLSKILGHTTLAMTQKVYAHLVAADLHTRVGAVNLGLQQPAAVVLPFKKAQ